MKGPSIQPVPVNESSVDELNAARKVYAGMLLAYKKLTLYPHGHNICADALAHCHSQFISFLNKYKTFKLEIERERIISKGEIVSEGLPEDGSFHFTLFRDGIRWIEFIEGIDQAEVDGILTIVNRYSKLSTEPEGDIVTAFWEAQFPHMDYEVAAFSWGGGLGPEEGGTGLAEGKGSASQFREKNLEGMQSPADPAIDPNVLSLNGQEQETLEQMIRSEEETDVTSYLDALLDCLLQHPEKENFNIILEVLSEEFTGSFARKEFVIALKILMGLHHVFEAGKTDAPWVEALMEDFFQSASSQESLSPLENVWKILNSEEAGTCSKIFKLLKSRAIHTLGILLSQPQPVPLRQILVDSITFLASQDMRYMETMLYNSDERLVEKLIPMIAEMEGGQSLKFLIKLTRHTSARIRGEATKLIFKRHADHAGDIFNLIDDKDESVRQLVLNKFGRLRNEGIEDLLISYLQKAKFGDVDGNHMLLCFKTLGKCGSSRAVPFLRSSLTGRGWVPGSRRSMIRRGAAIALALIGLPEAEIALTSASRSFYPSVRKAVGTARREIRNLEASSVKVG